MQDIHHIGVVGPGAWGTALAILCRRAGTDVTLWSRNANVIQSIHQTRMNETYLPGVFIDPSIIVTDKLNEISRHDTLLLAVPAQYLRSICIMLLRISSKRMCRWWCAPKASSAAAWH